MKPDPQIPALQDGQWPRRSAGIYGIKDQGQCGKVPDLSLRSPHSMRAGAASRQSWADATALAIPTSLSCLAKSCLPSKCVVTAPTTPYPHLHAPPLMS